MIGFFMTNTPNSEPNTKLTIKVWDIWVRFFHWFLVFFIALSYVTGEIGGLDFTLPGTNQFISNMNVHALSGVTILGLIIFRVIWGITGSTTARFTNFVTGPIKTLAYVKTVFKGPSTFFAGHNPAGGAVVMVILLALLAQTGTGLFSQDDSFFATKGPLAFLVEDETSKEVTGIHKKIWSYCLVTLILLHIAANLFYWLVKKQGLIMAMITGRRRLPDGRKQPKLFFASARLGAAITLGVSVLMWLLFNAERL